MIDADITTNGCFKHGRFDLCGHTDTTCPDKTDKNPKSEIIDGKEEKLTILRKKLENDGLTDEEYAEFVSLQMFPSNQRGRELTKKKILHTITPEERREWSTLKNEQRTMDKDISGLKERSERGDPNITRVEMNDCNSLNFSALEDQEKIIWTPSLSGCFAVAIVVEREDGSGTILLSHYQPMRVDENLKKMKEKLPGIDATIKTKRALVLVAEDYKREAKSSKWKLVSENKGLETILDTIRGSLGNDTAIIIEPYTPTAHVGRERDRSLVVKKTPKGGALYQTWYGDERKF